MPCYDARDNETQTIEVEKFHDGKMAAMLCATLTYITAHEAMPDFLVSTNWQEVGLPRTAIVSWWNDHIALDMQRKRKERDQLLKLNKENARKAALLKLTEADKQALGL